MTTQPNPNSNFTGRCSCAAITYTLAANPTRTYLCHCRDCKQGSGSSFSWQGWFPSSALTIQDPLSVISTFGDASKGEGTRQFCGRCGSPLFATVPDSVEALRGVVIVTVGSIDGSEESELLAPKHEGWCRRREAWMGEAKGAQQNDEW